MSYYAQLDDPANSGGDVATNSGWSAFVAWAEQTEGDQLRHLAAFGWSQELESLATELETAIDEGGNPDSLSIAGNLLWMLRDADGAATLVVTDGVGVQSAN